MHFSDCLFNNYLGLFETTYDESNLIQGTAFNEKVNPQNNLIRVYFFIFSSYNFLFFKKSFLIH